jgi:hypothetical protein
MRTSDEHKVQLFFFIMLGRLVAQSALYITRAVHLSNAE